MQISNASIFLFIIIIPSKIIKRIAAKATRKKTKYAYI